MGAMASQINSVSSVYSIVHSGADKKKHQSSASLAFVWVIHWSPVNFPHKWPVTRKMFPFDDVIMWNVAAIKMHFPSRVPATHGWLSDLWPQPNQPSSPDWICCVPTNAIMFSPFWGWKRISREHYVNTVAICVAVSPTHWINGSLPVYNNNECEIPEPSQWCEVIGNVKTCSLTYFTTAKVRNDKCEDSSPKRPNVTQLIGHVNIYLILERPRSSIWIANEFLLYWFFWSNINRLGVGVDCEANFLCSIICHAVHNYQIIGQPRNTKFMWDKPLKCKRGILQVNGFWKIWDTQKTNEGDFWKPSSWDRHCVIP